MLPQLDRLEQKDWDLARQLLRRCGDLGLLGVDVPEAYGGVGLDKVTSLVVSEKLARSASFGATFGAQANLTVIPLLLFGSEAQKQKYLPKLLSGEMIGAYGLSETGSGSDALGARTKATRQPDGSFLLNGEKMWITNGGFADLFIVFAKVDGDQFTAFLVERAFGVKSGKEEHKMGLHGSSTTALIFQDVKVPAENVLGEVGKGTQGRVQRAELRALQAGRPCAEGGAQAAIGESAKYAAERRQFGQPIASFGAIKHKIGEMVVRTYAVESLLYPTAGLVDARIAATPHEANDGSAALAAFEEYAVEASIAKVAGSEALDYVLDENIQIHGGNGYVRDYPAERHYPRRAREPHLRGHQRNQPAADSRHARAARGEERAAGHRRGQGAAGRAARTAAPGTDEGLLAGEQRAVESLKKSALMVFGVALQTYGEKLSDEQEVLMHIADMLIDVFAAESAVLRAIAASNRKVARAALQIDAARVFVSDAAMRVEASAKQALAAMVEGDTLRTMLAALRRRPRHSRSTPWRCAGVSRTKPCRAAAIRSLTAVRPLDMLAPGKDRRRAAIARRPRSSAAAAPNRPRMARTTSRSDCRGARGEGRRVPAS